MIDLYMAGTANGFRASVALEETGIPYRVHKVDLAKGEQRTPEFLKMNPAGAIPVIADSDGPEGKPLYIAQSGAIVMYLAAKSGKLIPRDARRRAQAIQYILMAASDIAGASGAIFQLEVVSPEKSPANIDLFKKRLLNYFTVIDQQLASREFLADEFSAADVMLYPNFFARKSLVDAAGGYENLQRWATTVGARPAVQKGMKILG
jgi:GSH-dependent disulfide-bond oxidoreductase